MEVSNCPSCNASIKGGVWSSNKLLPNYITAVINEVSEKIISGYCEKCGNDKIASSEQAIKEKITSAINNVNDLSLNIPLLSIDNPRHWNYYPFGIITAQSVTGTGVFSEINQSIADFLGTQSNSLTSKIKIGEDLCFAQLRNKAIQMGANAILGVDIDYAELGGTRGMVMVCCTGTAVWLDNLDILGDEICKAIGQIKPAMEEVNRIQEIYVNYTNQINN